MINFCTLFDSNYLTRGLALYHSLERSAPAFHLYVIAFNDDCYEYLVQAGLPHLTAISLKEFEDPELLNIKPTRSAAEYCWTCTPSVIQYCLNRFRLHACTYVDADMIFYSDPGILLEEMGDKSVLISEHRYTREYDQSELSGRYCVQFMCFRNNEESREVLSWWRDRCIEWCYARAEDGKFGDQKYLDDWTRRFQCVHVMQHLGGGVAPWNVQQYEIGSDRFMLVHRASGATVPLVFYHFHGLRFYTDDKVSCCGPLYEMDTRTRSVIYIPYINNLVEIGEALKDEGVTMNVNGATSDAPSKLTIWKDFVRERLVLLKIGNIKFMELELHQFGKHYHFYHLKSISKWRK